MENASRLFSHLPVEVILRCICSLSSFWDVLYFAATCRRNHQIWTANVTTIYHHISPRAIQCRPYARILLADQGGSSADSYDLTTDDVLQMMRNTVVVKKSLEEFNKAHVHDLAFGPFKDTGADYQFFDLKHLVRRPSYLIKPERARFVRGLYQLWSIIILEPEARHQRLRSLCFKDLAVVKDLSRYDNIMVHDKKVIDLERAHGPGHMELIHGDIYDHWGRIEDLLGWKPGPPSSVGSKGRLAIWEPYDTFKEHLTMKADYSWADTEDSSFNELWYDTPEEDLSD